MPCSLKRFFEDLRFWEDSGKGFLERFLGMFFDKLLDKFYDRFCIGFWKGFGEVLERFLRHS